MEEECKKEIEVAAVPQMEPINDFTMGALE